ncbi:MAG: DUF29 domain-containing protein [Tildeniella torsiva UHER 1998/13D]|jgi:hypothetical protein|nr:DUF29 domain-containing protein [Tildeniella torsiva UHER 1998/13D]
MEELIELRQYIEAHDYDKALELVADLEEMSKDDKLNKIYSYGIVLLVHLIKQQAEKRSTRSWEFSIYTAIEGIQRVNRRRKAGGTYANQSELADLLADGFEIAIRKAALEAFEGQYSDQELRAMVDPEDIQTQAMELIQR